MGLCHSPNTTMPSGYMSQFCLTIVYFREPQSSETGQTLSNQYVRTLSDKEKEQLMRMVQTPLSTDATDGGV